MNNEGALRTDSKRGRLVAFVAVAQMQQRLFVLPRKLREDLRLGHEATPFLNEKRFHPNRPI